MPDKHKWASVIRAWADGKIVQHRDENSLYNWVDYCAIGEASPAFNNSRLKWRVKPETVTKWQWLYRDSDSQPYNITDEYYANEAEVRKCIFYVQVRPCEETRITTEYITPD
jgi:hypothetical protein